PITVQQLLNQTSGLAEYAWAVNVGKTNAQLVDYIAGRSLEFGPGSKWKYANTNYFLLARVIEKASGVSYAQYVKEHVIEKAGLKATSYCKKDTPTAHPTTVVNQASGSDAWASGGQKLVAADRYDFALADGAGALCSTVSDLVIWQRTLFSGEV